MDENSSQTKEEVPEDAAEPVAKKKPKKKGTARDEELSTKEKYIDDLVKVAGAVEQGYKDQLQRADDQKDYWDIYNCKLNSNQAYDGRAQSYISLIRDAVNARKTRFVNQIFPKSGRSVSVTTEDGTMPHALMALCQFYIDRARVRTQVAPALSKNGDIEGQYNIYVTWEEIERHVVYKKTTKSEMGTVDSIVEETILDAGPSVECIPDADILVLPAIANSIDEALAMGGSVTITRRWSKSQIEKMIDDGDIPEDYGDMLTTDMKASALNGNWDPKKDHVSDTGIKAKGNWYLARETWHMLKVDGEMRKVRSYFGSDQYVLLGTKLNPLWCDRIPILSVPVEKISGAFKGGSLIEPCCELQYRANDFLNQGADAATFSLIPIMMTNLEKNPKAYTLTLDVGAVWPVDPNTSKIVEFPPLWQQAFELIGALKAQIQQSLGVNPSMIPSTSGKTKRSQADIANEQAVDVLTTSDSVTIMEEGIWTPMLQLFMELDAQFRHDELMIPMFGSMGKRIKMEKIPPIQMENKIRFKWLGVEAARNAAQMQQQIAFINVVKGVPPNLYKGKRLDLTAVMEGMFETMFGPELAPLTFVDLVDELSIDPEEENQMLQMGDFVAVSPMDDDKKHIQVHQQILAGDISGQVQRHIMIHTQAMNMKAMEAMQQQKGAPGQGGGPREGAQPGQPRPQGPPGQIPQDSLPQAGAVQMPRRAAGGNA